MVDRIQDSGIEIAWKQQGTSWDDTPIGGSGRRGQGYGNDEMPVGRAPGGASKAKRRSKSKPPKGMFKACPGCGSVMGKHSLPVHMKQCDQLTEHPRPPEQTEAPRAKDRRRLPEPDPDPLANVQVLSKAMLLQALKEAEEEAKSKPLEQFLSDVVAATASPRQIAKPTKSALPRRKSKSRTRSRQQDVEVVVAVPGGFGPGQASQGPGAWGWEDRPLETQAAKAAKARRKSAPPRKPRGLRTVTCHSCGKEFSANSIAFHQRKCEQVAEEQRRKATEAGDVEPDTDTSKSVCRKCGREVAQASMIRHMKKCKGSFNVADAAVVDQEAHLSSLKPCPFCKRKFKADRLAVHVKTHPEYRPPSALEQADATGNKGPKMLTCYLCGRGYGPTSLEIHIEKCRALWEDTEKLKSKWDRRPVPDPPAGCESIPHGRQLTRARIERYNNAAAAFFNHKSLYPCEGCARTFHEQALQIHMRSCAQLREKGGPSTQSSGHQRSKSMGRAARRQSVGPRMLTCYLCGKAFSASSLPIHLPRCQDLWEQQEAKKPASKRRPLPEPPEGCRDIPTKLTAKALQAFNDAAFSTFNDEALLPCPGCGRTFNERALGIHMRSCLKNMGPDSLPPDAAAAAVPAHAGKHKRSKSSGAPLRRRSMGPRMLTCYLCGRAFGSTSLGIHIPRCRNLWEQQEAKKPASERRPVPDPPEGCETIPKRLTEKAVQAFNEAAFSTFNDEALLPCPGCARTFNERALGIHMRSCLKKAGPDTVPPSAQPKASAASKHRRSKSSGAALRRKSAGPRMLTCYLCGRAFGSTSLGIHIPRCRDLWEQQEAKKPASKRRPVPDPPEGCECIPERLTDKAVQAFNDAAFGAFNQESLLPCPGCGRTFTERALGIHMRSCLKNKDEDEPPQPQARQQIRRKSARRKSAYKPPPPPPPPPS